VLSAAAMSGVQLVNVHALGGKACSKQRYRRQRRRADGGGPATIAGGDDFDEHGSESDETSGISGAPETARVKLAQLAKSAAVDGVVASVQEARAIRRLRTGFLIVTPACGRKNKLRPPSRTIKPGKQLPPRRFAQARIFLWWAGHLAAADRADSAIHRR